VKLFETVCGILTVVFVYRTICFCIGIHEWRGLQTPSEQGGGLQEEKITIL
jgi:hypothetical protein